MRDLTRPFPFAARVGRGRAVRADPVSDSGQHVPLAGLSGRRPAPRRRARIARLRDAGLAGAGGTAAGARWDTGAGIGAGCV